MKAEDFDHFARVLDAAYSLHSKSLTADARALFFASLGRYSLAEVRKAMSAHISDPQRGQYPPKPADLIAQLVGDASKDGRPDANEAWAIALRSRDERDTVVWTQECAEAFAVATPVLEGGDEVGARMAFKAAYERLVERNRADGAPAQWIKSLGHDPDLREAVLTQAVRSGRLQLADVRSVAPQLAAPEERFDPDVAEAGLARLRELVGGIPSAREKLDCIRAAHVAHDAAATADAKRRTAARVAEYQAAHA
ncbi:hypothetical protein KDX21_06880 [Burkholderia cenocepacia]|uniref:hypothetical protein n=1 Tax=Burkholderia cenocepacia TaxID=95486 RepID=UPI001B92FCD2|nr:hypothetical protein [Burkholderia cenocepacia]MBR8350296.1 hypothetical protein [Burkholderia cenocepacia]